MRKRYIQFAYSSLTFYTTIIQFTFILTKPKTEIHQQQQQRVSLQEHASQWNELVQPQLQTPNQTMSK